MPGKLIAFAIAIATAVFAQSGQPYSDLPYVPTPAKVVDAMLDLAGINAADVLVDLGSGDGRIVVTAAKRFGISATGVEIDPDLVLKSEQLAMQECVDAQRKFF